MIFLPGMLLAQCPGSYTSATLNWDNLDYLHASGSYYGGTNPVSGLPFVSASMWQTQRFAIGTNRVTLNTVIPAGGATSTYGDVNTHTGNAGGFNGADIHYLPSANGQNLTITFLEEVQNASFTLNDIDRTAVFTITAANSAPTAQTIAVTTYTSTILTIGGTSTARTLTATNTALGNTINTGAATITVAGPVKTIVVTVTTIGSNAEFFLSDITACVADPGFPSGYHATYTEPYTGQPAYFLANPQNLHVYMVNASTGVADYVFSDPGTDGTKLNSLAYDPVNKWLYYVMDGTAQGPINRKLKKYDFNNETISTVLSDISTLDIPTFIQGVEYAGAAFYNGSLYLGIEECDGSSYSNNAESVVWKIDFDGSGTPTTATQVFATQGDNGSGTVLQDWGDIVVKDGTLITTATSVSISNNQYIHTDLQTGESTIYTGNAESAGQLGMIWNGNLYRAKNAVALYNNDGTIGSQSSITTTSCSSAWNVNAGDASDPFRPKCDFGDAPASYDPVALSPAVHQQNCNTSTLRIGSAWDREWNKNVSADATGDEDDEDGITTVTIMFSDGNPYTHVQDVTVFNNTGADATLGGWLDYDADGQFEASEGVIITVPSSASPQDVSLSWSNLTVNTGTPNSFLRIRLVSGTGTLTTSNSTGWYIDGEVEDWPVISSDIALSITLFDFDAYATAEKKVSLKWIASSDDEDSGFEIQRSGDNLSWEKIGWKNMNPQPGNTNYNFLDQHPLTGNSYYRLKLTSRNGTSRLSDTKWIYLHNKNNNLKLIPNPVHNDAIIQLTAVKHTAGKMNVRNLAGQLLQTNSVIIKEGENRIPVNGSQLLSGVYLVEIVSKDHHYFTKMIIAH